jgi:opacity protein-like surface antigen
VALAATALAAALSASAALAAEKSAADDWYVEGGGYAQKDIVRVSLNTNGGLLIKSQVADGVEYITGYEAWGELNASKLNINAWRYEGKYEFREPVEAGSFNPTLGEPYSLPPFTIDGLTYSVVLTRADAGTVKISGYVDIDVAGRTEINADCAIWRQGTPKPEIPDTESGCDAGAGAPALFALGAALLGRRHTRR